MSTTSSDPSLQQETTASLIDDLLASLAAITERFESSEQEGWQWIRQHSSHPQLAELLQEMSPTAIRVFDAIGRLEPVNGITIAEQLRIPKGTVSKITRRLLANNLIRTESRPNNKKEIWFRLTALGRDLDQVHRAFDELMERGIRAFFHQYTVQELRLLVQIAQEASAASFVTLGQEAPISHGTSSEHGPLGAVTDSSR
jgi:DNA-binding MarR family transcriptional regulator